MSLIPNIVYSTQLTSNEVLFVQNIAGLSYAQGDILYYNGTNLTRLAAGTSGYYLKTQGAGANPLWAAVSGSGTVTDVSIVTANGISGSVANSTTTPAITLTLGVITPTSVNGLTFVAAATGFTIAGGTTSKTLTVSNTLTLAGTDTSTLNIGTGGTLGTAAFTAATAYAAALSGTINEIAYFNSSTTIASLAVATYPSLTELSYVKGLTSSAQTQITAKMTNPMTTGGDIIYGGVSGVPTRLANGSAGQVLQSNGTTLAPSWATAGAGDVVKVGTPVNNQVGVWTGDGTLEGDVDLTFDTTANTFGIGNGVGATSGSLTLGGATSGTGTFTGGGGGLTITTADGGDITIDPGGAGTTTINAGAGGVVISTDAGNSDIQLAPHGSGIIDINATVNISSLTASEMVITDGSKNLVSAAVATYPSLTELSYVKGLTSSAQTQITAALPKAGGTVTGTVLLAEGGSVGLDPSGSADGAYSGITMTATSGYSQAFGDLVYLSSVDSRWEAADADAATTGDRLLAMVVVAGTDGNACTLLMQGTIRADAKFPALTIGSAVYVGEAAGEIQVAIPTGADNVIRRVGYALTADSIYFCPSMDSQISVA